MTPKILKAGLLVGALVFALVSCGQNSKPMEELPADVPLQSGGEWTRKITAVIKDKDSDSLTLSNFSSTNAAVATIGVDKASNPTEIIITAGTLVPGTGQQRATVSFQVSDGTETITVSVKVTVTAPPLACMLGPAIVPDECPDGSLYNPIVIDIDDNDANTTDEFKYRFSDFITEAVDDVPGYKVAGHYPDGANIAVYISGIVAKKIPDDGTGHWYFVLDVTDDEDPTPDGTTVVLELRAEKPGGTPGTTPAQLEDDIVKLVYVKVIDSGASG